MKILFFLLVFFFFFFFFISISVLLSKYGVTWVLYIFYIPKGLASLIEENCVAS